MKNGYKFLPTKKRENDLKTRYRTTVENAKRNENPDSGDRDTLIKTKETKS